MRDLLPLFFIVMVGNNGYAVRVCFLRRILYGIDG